MQLTLSSVSTLELAEARRVVFAQGVRVLCVKYHGSVTSWGRTPRHNANLPGAVTNSKHLLWEAADVVWDDVATVPLAMLQQEAMSYEIRVLREQDHDHLETRPLQFP